MLAPLLVWQCREAPDFPVEPYIEFVSLSKDTLNQGIFQNDSLIVTFHFEDGDGDIGRTSQDASNNIFFIDERTGTLDNTFGIPEIPEEGAGNGVEGEVRIRLYSTCCLFPPESFLNPCEASDVYPVDTVQYRIYMKDRAGHTSNEIVTSPIILRCR